jgi:HEAT repeat protein
LITDKEPKKVSLWARVAVMRIEDNVTSAHLAEIGRLMTDHFLEVRVDAARALGAIGPQAFPCVPDLIGALRDESPDVQFWACFALGAIGPKADKALNALEQLTSSEDKVVREAARKAMDSIGNKIQKISGAEEPMPAKKQAGGR